MVKIMDAKSRSHFRLIFMAVQKPASNAVVIHVARKYDREYRFANGSGLSKPHILAKLRHMYRYKSVMTTVCHAVRRFESRADNALRTGGPCPFPLSDNQHLQSPEYNDLTEKDRETKMKQPQRLVSCENGPTDGPEYDLSSVNKRDADRASGVWTDLSCSYNMGHRASE